MIDEAARQGGIESCCNDLRFMWRHHPLMEGVECCCWRRQFCHILPDIRGVGMGCIGTVDWYYSPRNWDWNRECRRSKWRHIKRHKCHKTCQDIEIRMATPSRCSREITQTRGEGPTSYKHFLATEASAWNDAKTIHEYAHRKSK